MARPGLPVAGVNAATPTVPTSPYQSRVDAGLAPRQLLRPEKQAVQFQRVRAEQDLRVAATGKGKVQAGPREVTS